MSRAPDAPQPTPPSQPGESFTTITTIFPPAAETGTESTHIQREPPAHLFAPNALPAIPGYVTLREVARGGMGVVYAAHDPVFDREVAVKVMHHGQDAGRFIIESKVTARLPHPGVPPVYALGRLADARPFLAMKYITGRTLAAELTAADAPVDLSRQLGTFERICQTVGFAHAQGIVHRDLKPANVMVGAFGEVLVMDWGLAKEMRGSDQPALGDVKGTPAYLAPEQARGEPVDARADVFALGGILAVVLTGRPPFRGETVLETVQLAAKADLAPCLARLAACGADPDLLAVARRCLAADPGDRFADGAAVAAAVARYRAGVAERLNRAELDRAAAEARAAEEVNTRREAEARAVEQRKRQRVQLALAAAVLLLATAVGAGAWWQDRQTAARNAEREQVANEQRVADLRRQLEEDRRTAARNERNARNAERILALLDQCEAALKSDDAESAAIVLAEAERRAADGGADHLAARVARCRTDAAFLRDLDRIDELVWISRKAVYLLVQPRAVHDAFSEAFTRFGIVPGTTPVDRAVGQANGSLVKERVVAALDEWLGEGSWSPGMGQADALAVLRGIDPDEFRNAVRGAITAQASEQIVELAGREQATQQPWRFALVLGQHAAVPPDRRKQLLVAALAQRPGDFKLLTTLGHLSLRAFEQKPDAPPLAAESEKWFRAAVAVRPKYAPAHFNLGIVLHTNKATAEAVTAFQAAVRLDPKDFQARYNLGIALHTHGNLDGSIATFEELIRLEETARAHLLLGESLWAKGQVDQAIRAYKSAIRLVPSDADAHYSLGNALGVTGDVAGALDEYACALRHDPKHVAALNGLAWLLATGPDWGRDGSRAVQLAFRACELSDWKVPTSIDTLAAAHAEVGNFQKAIELQHKALSSPEFDKREGPSARVRLVLFIQGKPFRDPDLTGKTLAPPPRAITRP